jgi:endonuclease/exonuclease/phosphatase family metal-dependent hydrolase
MRLLVRTWNVFHGRTVPASGRAHVEEAVRLVTRDRPGVVCLQELPVLALPELEAWSGMQSVGAVAMRPHGGPAGRASTERLPDVLRSALAGQANAVLVAPGLEVRERAAVELNPAPLRRSSGLPFATRRAWAANRRVGQLVRIGHGRVTVLVAHAHLTASPDSRPAELELTRLLEAADRLVTPGEPLLLAGDLNLTTASSRLLAALPGRGFTAAGPGIDHLMARGLRLAGPPQAWPPARRALGAVLLSDHAPVEAEMIGL